MNDDRRVVVTGLGLATPLGDGRESSWRALLENRSAVSPEGARVPGAGSPDHTSLSLAMRAAEEAWEDAGLSNQVLPPPLRGRVGEGGDFCRRDSQTHPPSRPSPSRGEGEFMRMDSVKNGERWGCLVSGSKPLLSEDTGGKLRWDPPEIVPQTIARRFGLHGPVANVMAACATGTQSAILGALWIQEGRCDAVLAGSAESSFHPLYQAGFARMGVLSKNANVRPFDRRRDGFVMGEGAGVFVLESLASARERGAKIYAELTGWDMSSDAHHAARFNGNGARMAKGLGRALARAGREFSEMDYINAHGTATPLNDALEAAALESLIESRRPIVSSTKAATGHLLGATGAVELGFCLLALRDDRVPATLNLEDPLSKKIDFVPGKSREIEVRRAVSLSFGFGGTIAAAVLEAVR